MKNEGFSRRYPCTRDVYVLDNTVNFMLNKRKSKKAAGAKPQTPLEELSVLSLAVTGGARPLPYPPPVLNIFIRPPLSQNPGSAPELRCVFVSAYARTYVCACSFE